MKAKEMTGIVETQLIETPALKRTGLIELLSMKVVVLAGLE